METIADRLNAVKQVKTDIKTAIAEKGLDMEGVPFTQYAEKVAMIGATEIIPLEVTENGTYTAAEGVAFNPVTVDVKGMLKALLDFTQSSYGWFQNLAKTPDNWEDLIPYNATENVTNMYRMFQAASCELPLFDTRKAYSCGEMFSGYKGTVIPAYDFRTMDYSNSVFHNMQNIREIWVKNIKNAGGLQVGSGSSWGHLLTVESLIHLIKELRQTTRSLTLTIGNVNLEKLANVYVRLVEITDEMRAEDDLIDEKLPFEVCESTDDGAVLITDYVALKSWTLA